MKLSEYNDEEIIEELKHRGIKIELWDNQCGQPAHDVGIKIGGVDFEPHYPTPKHGDVPNVDCLASHNCVTCKHNQVIIDYKPCVTCLSMSCQYEKEEQYA